METGPNLGVMRSNPWTQPLKGIALAALLLAGFVTTAEAAETVLKGRIIRSLSVHDEDTNHVLVGQKGSKAGLALVFASADSGRTWVTLNNGKPLSPDASDVQAVARVDDRVILAGTWKLGLYRSRDDGASFRHAGDFPSTDIRDLQVTRRDGMTLVYAATARDGVFLSKDAGVSWQALGPGRDFFWSLTAAPGGGPLYAVSLEQAVYRGDGAGGWEKIFDQQNAFALAAAADGRRLAIAAGAGGFLSDDAGATWRPLAALAGEKFADALFLDGGELIFASWSNGLAVVDPATGAVRRLLPGLAAVHLQAADDRLLVGTWGQGITILPLGAIAR